MKKMFLILIIFGLLISGANAINPPWCASQNIFFWNASSDISGYRIMDNIPELASQTTITTSVSAGTGPKVVGEWITQVGSPGITTIAPGLITFNTYASVTTTPGTTTIKYNLINRSSSGVETDLFYGNAITHDINSGEPDLHIINYARRNSTTLFPGDRLVIRATAITTSASLITMNYYLGGNTNASMVTISYFMCPFLNNNESYAYSPSSATPLSQWVVIALTAIGLFICAFYFRMRNEDGEISKERVIFSIVSSVVCGIAAYLSLEIIIPSGGVATSVVYQMPVISILFIILSILAFANFIYCIMQKDMVQPDKKDYKNDNGERM